MDNLYNVLYASTVCSTRVINLLFLTSEKKPLMSAQKYHRLLISGLRQNSCKVTAITAIPVFKSHKRIIWSVKPEMEDGTEFIYPFFFNLIFIRHVFIFINAFVKSLIWCIKNQRNSFVICDILNISVSNATKLAAKLMGIRVIGIVTDLPFMQFKQSSGNDSIMRFLALKSSNFTLSKYDAFIFLTNEMNEVINNSKRPYTVIEGISEGPLQHYSGKSTTRNILYSGGLFENNGLIKLVDAFKQLKYDDIRLMIFGSGELETYLLNCMKDDKRIIYFGMQPNEIVVEGQVMATLLVNPRASDEEYTKYSFPSKNIEYMTSGTPLVTTALPGIPQDYFDYVYLFKDETTTGIFNTLSGLLTLPREDLLLRGSAAKEFMITKKNRKVQAAKVLALFTELG